MSTKKIESAADVPQIVIKHDGQRYDLEEVVKWHAKNLDISGTGDVAERILDDLAKRVESGTPDERISKLKGAFSKQGASSRRVAKGKEHLWCFQSREYRGDVEVGSGDLITRALYYQHANAENNASLDWGKMKAIAQHHGDAQMVDIIEKSQTAGDFSLGGAILPDPLAADLIGFLFDANVVRAAGAFTIEMPAGKLDFGRINSQATASWVGETGTVNASDINMGRLELNAKKLKITNIVSNDLVRRSPQGVLPIMRRQIQQAAENQADISALRGTGTGGSPAGIKTLVDSGQIFTRAQGGATSTLEEIVHDLFKMVYLVVGNNIPMDRPAFIMHDREKYGLMGKVDGDGNLTRLMDMLADDMLFGFPVLTTNALPITLGGGDEGEVYFGDFAQMVIGETMRVRIDETTEASVTDSNGNVVDLFDTDQRALRLIHEVDYGLFYDTAFSVAEGVDWGADVVG